MQEIFLAYSRESAFALPAVHLDISPGRGFRSLCAAWPGRNIAGNKWFGVRPTMPGQRGVGVQALYLLNDYGTGVPLAVISANQLTGIRTASMSAFVLRAILTDPPPTVGFIGCGLQASFHLKMIHSLFPELTSVLCYSRSVVSANALANEAHLSGITAKVLDDPQAVITGSQVIVTSIPLGPDMRPFLLPDLVKPGAVVLAVDLARPWYTEGLSSFELKITDDHKQQAQLAPISSTLGPYGSFDADLSDIAAGKRIAFDPYKDRAVFAFRGFSLADLGIANLIYEKSRARELGKTLDR
jgi:ornithine cyclodeaminase/alanine dehydrogenase